MLRLTACLMLTALATAQSELEPATALASLLDLQSPEARLAAADKLAARTDVTLAQWLAAAKSVPLHADDGEAVDERTRRYQLPLWVMQSGRATEILVRVPANPTTPGGAPRPLLLVGHETDRDAQHAIASWAPLADRFGLVLASWTEPYEPYRTVGWAFKADAQQTAVEVLRAVRRRYDIDENRIVLGGVGRGGHMTWDIALRNPDLFAGVIAANGSPRLGNVFWDNNMAFIEALAATPVRALQWGPREPVQLQNQRRALQLLQRFGNRDARSLVVKDLAAAFAAPDAGWEAFFAYRRSVASTLARVPAIGDVPLAAQFGRRHWFDVVRTDPKLEIKWPMQVPASKWNKLDEQGRRDLMDDYVRDLRPRLQVARTAPGTFVVTERSIHAFRLLLTPELCDAKGDVIVQWHAQELRRHATPSAAVLLRDFAERFDRTFLPVIEIAIP